jgi:predicted nucleic acid-binding protein
MPAFRYLIDTNILLRLRNNQSEDREVCKEVLRILRSQYCPLHYTLQNAAEFWNVSTRPVDRNGHGLSQYEATQGLIDIEQTMTLLPDDSRVYATWRKLVVDHNVQGVQVHDAKLTAAMMVHSVPRILTFNAGDFARYPEIEAVHPLQLKRDHAH